MDEIKLFEKKEFGFKVRTILNPDGSISVSAEDTAIGYGWSRTEVKSGREYTSIMWARMNGYCKELGFAHECAKDDYIPESLFYMLGFKAGNDRALKYQQWLAMEVLPSLRKTGSYEMSGNKRLSQEEMMRIQLGMLDKQGERLDGVESRIDHKVNSRNNTPTVRFEEARIYLDNWEPPINLKLDIEKINTEKFEDILS